MTGGISFLHYELTTTQEQSPSEETTSCPGYSRNSPLFMEPECSKLCSQEPDSGPYPEPDESSHHPANLFLGKLIFILSSYLRLYLPNCSFLSDFSTINLYKFLITRMRATFLEYLP
jgi:hypothetical protein